MRRHRSLLGLTLLCALTVACDAPLVTSQTTSALGTFTNGSFETLDYTGWTLLEEPAGAPEAGTFGVIASGQTLTSTTPLFDFHDLVTTTSDSPGLPITYNATDGEQVAFLLQAGAHRQRMYQTIDVPFCLARVRWDMAHTNHHTGFDPATQYIAVNARAADDTLLGTLFVSDPSFPMSRLAMTPTEADASPFAGQTVRLEFEVRSEAARMDVALDNIRLECDPSPPLLPTPAGLDFGNVRVATVSAPRTVSLGNTAPNSFKVTAMAVTNGAFTLTPPGLPVTLAPNTGTSFSMVFTPDLPGPFMGQVAVDFENPASPLLIPVTGVGVQPLAAFDLATLPLGSVAVGSTSSIGEVILTNEGTDTLAVSAVTATPPFTVVAPTTGFSLPPGQPITIQLTFTPTVGGVALGQLNLISDTGGTSPTVDLTGTGLGLPIGFDAASLAFAPQKVGTTSQTRFVTLINNGTGEIGFPSVTATAPFNVTAPLTNFSLPPGQSQIIELTYTPTAPGPTTGTLTVTSTDASSPHTLPLMGFGAVGALVPTPQALMFGNIRTGAPSVPQPLVVTNPGDSSLTVTQIQAPPGYVIDGPPLPFGLLPGAQETLTVTFAPTADGPAAGAIAFTSSAGPVSVPVSATAVPRALVADRASLSFGSVVVGGASAAQLVTVTNTTAGPVRVERATPRGEGIVIDPPPPRGEIPPGGSVTFGIRISPVATGALTSGVDLQLVGVTSPDVGVDVTGSGKSDSSGCSASTGGAPWWLGALGLGLVRRRRRR